MAKMVSLRIDEELLEWVDGYAKERGVSRTDLVAEALRSLRVDAGRGVPDLVAPGANPFSISARAARSVPGVQRASSLFRDSDAMARQAKLNKAKYS